MPIFADALIFHYAELPPPHAISSPITPRLLSAAYADASAIFSRFIYADYAIDAAYAAAAADCFRCTLFIYLRYIIFRRRHDTIRFIYLFAMIIYYLRRCH